MFSDVVSYVLNTWKSLVGEQSVKGKGKDGGRKASRGKYFLGLGKWTS